jgi:hypothetical protein
LLCLLYDKAMNEKPPLEQRDALTPTSELAVGGPKKLESQSDSIRAAVDSLLKQNAGLAERIAKAFAPLQEFRDRLLKSLELNRETIASGAQRALEVSAPYADHGDD